MNSSFKVVAGLMPLWGVAWWTCMQNVGIEDTWRVFNNMPSPNVVSWNAMTWGM
jgi:hypothetical protein